MLAQLKMVADTRTQSPPENNQMQVPVQAMVVVELLVVLVVVVVPLQFVSVIEAG